MQLLTAQSAFDILWLGGSTKNGYQPSQRRTRIAGIIFPDLASLLARRWTYFPALLLFKVALTQLSGISPSALI